MKIRHDILAADFDFVYFHHFAVRCALLAHRVGRSYKHACSDKIQNCRTVVLRLLVSGYGGIIPRSQLARTTALLRADQLVVEICVDLVIAGWKEFAVAVRKREIGARI